MQDAEPLHHHKTASLSMFLREEGEKEAISSTGSALKKEEKNLIILSLPVSPTNLSNWCPFDFKVVYFNTMERFGFNFVILQDAVGFAWKELPS